MANDIQKSNIRLIIGSHGSGKSDWLYNRFISMSRNEKDKTKIDLSKKLFLVVPEQDTNDKQRLMMKKMSECGYGAGIFNIDVVSFDRIAHNVFDILSIEPAKENVIDDDAKAMILSLLVSELNKQNELKYYRRMINKMGFAKKLTEAVSELYSYNVSDEEVLKASNSKYASYITKGKLIDLAKIFKGFKNKLKELNYFIKEDKYDLLNKSILKTNIFNDSIVAFDGFTGFTPVQLDIFKKIANVAKEVYVLIDHRNPKTILDYDFTKMNVNIDSNVEDVFYLSKKFIKDIMYSVNVSDVNVLLDEDSIKEKVVKYSDDKNDLRFIESHLYKNVNFEGLYNDKTTNVESYVANTIEEEVRNAVQVVLNLTRNKGYKYNDIKIVVSSIQSYRNSIIRNFNKSNIPLFIDDSESILNSPYIEVIRAAIDVINYNFSYDSIVRYINSGIFEKSRESSLFDNFIRKHGIRGYNRYKTGFEKIIINLSDKESIMNFKKEFINPLIELYESIKVGEKHEIKIYIESLLSLIEKLDIDSKFESLIHAIEKGTGEDITLYKELTILKYSKEIIEKTFKQIIDIQKNNDEKITLDSFKLMFEVGITSKSVKSIPYLIDQVVVGDLMRSRFDNTKVEIVLGLNQSYIPARTSDMTIIDDEMRMIFANEVKELSQTTVETALNQRFYIYLALTNPIDKLILSYTRTDANGDADEKSSVLIMLENMFIDQDNVDAKGNHISKLKSIEIDESKFKIYNKKDLITFIALNMQNIKNVGKKDDKGNAKYNFDKKSLENIYKSKELIKYLEKVDKEEFDKIYNDILYQRNNYKAKNISSEINSDLIKLKDGKFNSSASSIESFNTCPYMYFLKNTLKIDEKEEYSIKPVDLGNLAHKVFENVFSDFDIVNKDKDVVNSIVDKEVEDNFKLYDSFNEFDKNDNDYFGVNRLNYVKGRTKLLIQKSVSTLIDIAKSSNFKVTRTEGKFDYSVGEESIVKGRIDRVETYDDGNNIYVNVIDYKSGKEKSFDKKKLENGTDIQLVLYVDYCLNEKYRKDKPVFCGSFYFNLNDKISVKDIDVTVDSFNKSEKGNIGYKGIANANKDVLDKVFVDAEYDTKKDGSVKNLRLKNDYSIGGKYISEDELSEYIGSLHITIDNTTKRIKSGDIRPLPVDYKSCNKCPYMTICKKDQMIVSEETESEN